MNTNLLCLLLQRCALEVLGFLPVVFQPCYQDAWLRGEYASLQDTAYMWDRVNGRDQWWIDAFTVDPTKMLEGMTGLWETGIPQPVIRTRLENASVGTLPNITVYIAVHPQHGTHAFYPYHGAKGGGGDKTGDGKMYEGFKFWFSEMTAGQLGDVVQHQYCNQPDGVSAFYDKASSAQQDMFEETPADATEFQPVHFMVCPDPWKMQTCDKTAWYTESKPTRMQTHDHFVARNSTTSLATLSKCDSMGPPAELLALLVLVLLETYCCSTCISKKPRPFNLTAVDLMSSLCITLLSL